MSELEHIDHFDGDKHTVECNIPNCKICRNDPRDRCWVCDDLADPKYVNICSTCDGTDSGHSFYCSKCIRGCTMCGKICCTMHCYGDDMNYLRLEEIIHVCSDGKCTGELVKCEHRYCEDCVYPCDKCGYVLVKINKGTCTECSKSEN